MIEVIGSAGGVLVRSWATFREVQCPGYAASSLSHGHGVPPGVCPDHRKTPAAAGAGQRHTWVEYTPSKELYDEWESLPLIVLAGLR